MANACNKYHDGYAKLAAAILTSGRCDKWFQESEWAEDLRELCRLDLELHRRNTDPTGNKIQGKGGTLIC